MKFFYLLMFLFSTFSMAAENNLYDFDWLDADKEIYVLQNRKFRKKGSFYLGGVVGKTLSGPFVDSYGGGLKAGFFFKEDWGFEIGFGTNTAKTNDVYKNIRQNGTVAFHRDITNSFTGHLLWSPFYNKINTFNQIFYYDLMFGLGFAQLNTEDNREEVTVTANEQITTEALTGLSWLIAWRFFLNQSWSVRFDITAFHYQADRYIDTGASTSDTKEDWFHQYDMGVGLNFSF